MIKDDGRTGYCVLCESKAKEIETLKAERDFLKEENLRLRDVKEAASSMRIDFHRSIGGYLVSGEYELKKALKAYEECPR